MVYELTIRRMDENPQFQELQEKRHWDPLSVEPRYLVSTVLKTVITEAQFQAIRKAVLEQF